MKVDLFDFDLPEDRIATRPVTPRDAARLLYVGQELKDHHIYDLPHLLQPGDLLVLNNTRVIPARLFGKRGDARVEVTLHKQIFLERSSGAQPDAERSAGRRHGLIMEQEAKSGDFVSPEPVKHRPCENQEIFTGQKITWACFAKPAKKLRVGDLFAIAEDFTATVEEKLESGEVVLSFAETQAQFLHKLERYGTMPIPPYMKRAADTEDERNYQTVFAKTSGAVAAPTAGLHFTPELMAALRQKGMETVEVTLHVGAGTFLPVKVDDTEAHQMHSEWIDVTEDQARTINKAKREGRRIVAVGTTALRTLESVTDEQGIAHAFTGETDIFITPGYAFKCVDVLLTNFHLPRSTLFMLVSAFAGLETMKGAYQHAIDNHYRFYSYGDACLLERCRKACRHEETGTRDSHDHTV